MIRLKILFGRSLWQAAGLSGLYGSRAECLAVLLYRAQRLCVGGAAFPVKFLFEVRKPDETLRHVSESVMRGVISDRTVGALLKRQESFNKVNQTQQPKKRLINEARREYNKIILSAEAENEQGIQEADGWRRYVDQE